MVAPSKCCEYCQRNRGNAERAQRLTRRVHRPDKHVAVIDQHLDRVLERAFVIGPATFGVVQAQARARKHPEETLRRAQVFSDWRIISSQHSF